MKFLSGSLFTKLLYSSTLKVDLVLSCHHNLSTAMPTASPNDEAVTFDQAAKVFREKYPNWRDNKSFLRIFSKLKELTRIDSERTAQPRKVFRSFLDQSDISLKQAKQYTGRLDLQDWFVIFAFFADCSIKAFSGRFSKMLSENAGDRIPLHQLKNQLVTSADETVSSSASLEMFDLTEYEQSLLEHCIESVESEVVYVQIGKASEKCRQYQVVGKANSFTKQAAEAISCSYQNIYQARKDLSDKKLLWIEGGKQSREKGKRIAVWKMLL